MRNAPVIIILRALQSGQTIHGCQMSEDGRIGQDYGDSLAIVPWDVNDFIAWCNKFSQDELVAIAAQTALMSTRRD